MDMCMVDVSDMPEVRAGDIVTVFGDEPEATELAALAGTISYELLCAISPRVPRVYRNECEIKRPLRAKIVSAVKVPLPASLHIM